MHETFMLSSCARGPSSFTKAFGSFRQEREERTTMKVSCMQRSSGLLVRAAPPLFRTFRAFTKSERRADHNFSCMRETFHFFRHQPLWYSPVGSHRELPFGFFFVAVHRYSHGPAPVKWCAFISRALCMFLNVCARAMLFSL